MTRRIRKGSTYEVIEDEEDSDDEELTDTKCEINTSHNKKLKIRRTPQPQRDASPLRSASSDQSGSIDHDYSEISPSHIEETTGHEKDTWKLTSDVFIRVQAHYLYDPGYHEDNAHDVRLSKRSYHRRLLGRK